MMIFTFTLEPAASSELTKSLTPLASFVQYDQALGTLTVDDFDEANKPAIVEIIAKATRGADFPPSEEIGLPSWGDLAKDAERIKRMAAARERTAMQAIRAKRRRQAGVRVERAAA